MVVVPPRRLSPSLGHGIGNPQRLSMSSVASTTTAPLHDVAVALEHTHDDICMVHGDVSASKYVLLDVDGRTRLCDLGSGYEGTFPATVALQARQRWDRQFTRTLLPPHGHHVQEV